MLPAAEFIRTFQADDLIALVQANEGKPLKLYVYNVDSDAVREVTLTPNSAWGGEGWSVDADEQKLLNTQKYSVYSLGCGIGFGYLHRIPAHVDRSTRQSPLSANSPAFAPGGVILVRIRI